MLFVVLLLNCSQQKLAVVGVYQSPSLSASMCLDELGQLLSKLLLCSCHVILAGDINVNMMSDCAVSTNHLAMLNDFHLVQCVTGPSRVTDTSSTLIDHIVCTPAVLVLSVRQAIGVSDHRVQIANLDIIVQRPIPAFHWICPFRKCCWSDIREYLSSVPWSVNSPDDMWGFFYEIISTCLDKYVPLKKVRSKYSKRHTPWLSPDVMSAIRVKQRAKCIVEHLGNPEDISRYKQLKNQLKNIICSAKLHCLQTLLHQSRKCSYLAAKL